MVSRSAVLPPTHSCAHRGPLVNKEAMFVSDDHVPEEACGSDIAVFRRHGQGLDLPLTDALTHVHKALLAGMALLVLLHVIPPLVKPSSFVQDDSYFYMQIASNIVQGNG